MFVDAVVDAKANFNLGLIVKSSLRKDKIKL